MNRSQIGAFVPVGISSLGDLWGERGRVPSCDLSSIRKNGCHSSHSTWSLTTTKFRSALLAPHLLGRSRAQDQNPRAVLCGRSRGTPPWIQTLCWRTTQRSRSTLVPRSVGSRFGMCKLLVLRTIDLYLSSFTRILLESRTCWHDLGTPSQRLIRELEM